MKERLKVGEANRGSSSALRIPQSSAPRMLRVVQTSSALRMLTVGQTSSAHWMLTVGMLFSTLSLLVTALSFFLVWSLFNCFWFESGCHCIAQTCDPCLSIWIAGIPSLSYHTQLLFISCRNFLLPPSLLVVSEEMKAQQSQGLFTMTHTQVGLRASCQEPFMA